MSYSSIVSYHTNPYTCGVARFNHALASLMGIRVISVTDFVSSPEQTPMISIKFEEISEGDARHLHEALQKITYDVFLHGVQNSELESSFLRGARNLYVASTEIANELKNVRSDLTVLFAPGAEPINLDNQFDLTLLTFGMAHKIRASGYKRLGEILRSDSRTAQLEISTALHEGTSFSEEFFAVSSEISEAFAGNVRFLGFLSDPEVSNRLRKADALIAFFPNGVRENNTTVLSAMSHGCAVITNLDDYSPKWMKHAESIFDINKLDVFPTAQEVQAVRDGAVKAVATYNFRSLSEILMSRIK